MSRRITRIPGRYGSTLRVSDWGDGEVSIRPGANDVNASLTIKGVRKLIALLQRIESAHVEPL